MGVGVGCSFRGIDYTSSHIVELVGITSHSNNFMELLLNPQRTVKFLKVSTIRGT